MTSYAISTEGLGLIQEFEGFRASPAQLPDGNWVVGHGHVRIGEAGGDVSESEAGDLLALDLAPVERSVNTKVSQTLTQAQFDALVSFALSVGVEAFEASQVLRRVNAGDFVQAACAMDAWRKSDVSGELEIIDALVRRRAAEKALFLKGAPHDASPSVFMRAKLDHAASILGAPVKYAPAPVVGSVPFTPPPVEAGHRISEILKSEPATEALLLTQVVVEDAPMEEINTAHAKPVARTLEDARRALWSDAQAKSEARSHFWGKFFSVRRPAEVFGLVALFVFGLALMTIGGSMVFNGAVGVVDFMGASAFAAPGLAAALMAAFGLWRGPFLRPARA